MELQIGDLAPDFSLLASTGNTISLKGIIGKKVVLYFYPKDDTPGCTKEACGFRDTNDDLKNLGVVVLGVSKDSLKSHDKFINKYNLNFTLLVDENGTVSDLYGAWGEKKLYGKVYMGIRRMTFLIGEDGAIEKIWSKVNPEVHAQQVLDSVKSDLL